jgi:hypothetical protein
VAKKKASKKPVAKKSKGSKGKKALTNPKVTHIFFVCFNNSCLESIHQASIGPGNSVVVLSAVDTDVTLDFSPYSGSPFKSGGNTISINANKSKHMRVDPAKPNGVYTYDISCSACSYAAPPGPPEMIVP